MTVAILISIMISIIVGVALVPTIVSTVNTVKTTPAASPEVVALINILPYVIVAVILLGAVAWIGYNGYEDSVKVEKPKRKREISLKIILEKASQDLGQYINNLDNLLGIKTIIIDSNNKQEGLVLTHEGELYISNLYDWYIVDRLDTEDMFKVVGVHKKDDGKRLVYILGKREPVTGPAGIPTPYLYKVVMGAYYPEYYYSTRLQDTEVETVRKEIIGRVGN
jgi:hypothetical protein